MIRADVNWCNSVNLISISLNSFIWKILKRLASPGGAEAGRLLMWNPQRVQKRNKATGMAYMRSRAVETEFRSVNDSMHLECVTIDRGAKYTITGASATRCIWSWVVAPYRCHSDHETVYFGNSCYRGTRW